MKKIIVLLLCIAMCIPFIASCGGDDPTDTSGVTTAANDPAVTTEPDEGDGETERVNVYPNVVKQNWDGYQFKILHSTLENVHTDFLCENPNGNVLNDQVYQRNTMVERDLGIDIYVQTYDGNLAKSSLASQCAAGWTEGDYNFFGGQGRSVVGYIKNGYMADLGSYDQINLYNDYWEQGFVDQFMVDDSIYSIVGDISVANQISIQVMCFNKNLFRENGREDPYNLVKTKEWTVDALLGYMEGFSIDYDNDGYDWDKDRFALSGWGSEASYGIFYGSGFTFTKNDGETLALDFDRDLLDELMDVTLDVWSSAGSYINMSSSDAQHHMPHDIFSTGRGLFCDISCAKIGNFFSEMEDDYGILPEPMLNREQGEYYTYAASTYPAFCVPKTDPNPERTGNILEALCAASSDVVIPKMLEIVTKIQNARDEESAEMLDIALSNKIYDAAHWFNLEGIYNLPRAMISEGQNLTSSYLQRYEGKARDAIEEYVELVNSFEN